MKKRGSLSTTGLPTKVSVLGSISPLGSYLKGVLPNRQIGFLLPAAIDLPTLQMGLIARRLL